MNTKQQKITPYEQQANDFLSAHNIKFRAEFLENGKHFSDDKENRDIYNLFLTRSGKTISFRFGNSLADSPASSKELAALIRTYGERSKFVTKAKTRRVAPTAYDLLSSIQSYSPGSFEDFCADSGFDPDSRKAESTWRSVVEEWFKVESFFSPDELNELAEIN